MNIKREGKYHTQGEQCKWLIATLLRAVLAMIAFVENKIAPLRVIKKPAVVILLFRTVSAIVKVTTDDRQQSTESFVLFGCRTSTGVDCL